MFDFNKINNIVSSRYNNTNDLYSYTHLQQKPVYLFVMFTKLLLYHTDRFIQLVFDLQKKKKVLTRNCCFTRLVYYDKLIKMESNYSCTRFFTFELN